MNHWRPALYVLLGASSYGILSTIVKTAYRDGYSPGQVTGSQILLGALLLCLVTTLLRQWERLTVRQGAMLVAAGMFVGLTGVCYYSSLQYIPATMAVVLLFQFTWIGVLIEAVLERAWPTGAKIVSLLLLFAGTWLAGDVGDVPGGRMPWIGIVLGFGSAVCYAGFILASGRLSTHVNPWMRSTLMSLGSLLIVFLVFPPGFLTDGSLGGGLWWWGILLAFFGIFLPNVLFTYGVPRIGPGLAAILGSVELPVAVGMSWLVLDEQVAFLQWLGVFIILFAIGVSEIRFKKQGPSAGRMS